MPVGWPRQDRYLNAFGYLARSSPLSTLEHYRCPPRCGREVIEGYDCDACRKRSTERGRPHVRSKITQHASVISTTGDVLVVVLYRFAHALDAAGNFRPMKVRRKVACPPELALGSGSYRLFAMISHLGTTLSAGHYVAAVRSRRNGAWYECNDETVTPLSSRALCDGQAVTSVRDGAEPYILFYQRRPAPSASLGRPVQAVKPKPVGAPSPRETGAAPRVGRSAPQKERPRGRGGPAFERAREPGLTLGTSPDTGRGGLGRRQLWPGGGARLGQLPGSTRPWPWLSNSASRHTLAPHALLPSSPLRPLSGGAPCVATWDPEIGLVPTPKRAGRRGTQGGRGGAGGGRGARPRAGGPRKLAGAKPVHLRRVAARAFLLWHSGVRWHAFARAPLGGVGGLEQHVCRTEVGKLLELDDGRRGVPGPGR